MVLNISLTLVFSLDEYLGNLLLNIAMNYKRNLEVTPNLNLL